MYISYGPRVPAYCRLTLLFFAFTSAPFSTSIVEMSPWPLSLDNISAVSSCKRRAATRERGAQAAWRQGWVWRRLRADRWRVRPRSTSTPTCARHHTHERRHCSRGQQPPRAPRLNGLPLATATRERALHTTHVARGRRRASQHARTSTAHVGNTCLHSAPGLHTATTAHVPHMCVCVCTLCHMSTRTHVPLAWSVRSA